MAYAVEIAQAMSLYHITGIRIYYDVTWLANVETGLALVKSIKAINGDVVSFTQKYPG